MHEFLDFDVHPGSLYVIATLLPLLSFVLILLTFGIKAYFRKSPEGSSGETIYLLLGGPLPSRGGAYVATGAIALACVLSIIGFIRFASSHAADEAEVHALEHKLVNVRDQRVHAGDPSEIAKAVNKLKSALSQADKGGAEERKKLEEELHKKEKELQKLENNDKEFVKEIRANEERLEEVKSKWAAKLTWVAVHPTTQRMSSLEEEIQVLEHALAPPTNKGAKADAEFVKKTAEKLQEKRKELKELRAFQPATMLNLGFRIDMLSAVMFAMVTFIATLIHIYSMGYMSDELDEHVADHQVHTADGHLHRRGRFGRFFLYLSLFCFSMLNLVLADNLFQVFVSWELVGICSYLLIGFYFERQSASNAANKAFITNRVGDAGFVIGLMILWTYVGTFNFEEIFTRLRAPMADSHHETSQLAGQIVRANPVPDLENLYQVIGPSESFGPTTQAVLWPLASEHFHNLDKKDKKTGAVKYKRLPVAPANSVAAADFESFGVMPYWMLVAAGLGIFLGCVGKSAQFPLQVWLPDAMEGPTPVSALIHAATMVAAGVYLVGRCFPLFTMEALLVIAYTGAITLFVAATIALVMTDIKKVLAYSTVSQLGYMMLALGIGGWVAGLFHLITHAFFKALLFLGSGSVIYGCHHEQEMTKMGGLYPKMKITALTMLVGVLAIAGTPLFSGWYSKDAILAQAFGFGLVNKHHFLLFILPLLTAGITTFYMFRMWFMTFAGKPRNHHVSEHAHESPSLMTAPLVVLAFFSVVVAWGWPVWDPEQSWLEHQLHHAQPESVMADFGVNWEIDKHWNPTKPNAQTGALGVYDFAWHGPSDRNEDASVRVLAHQNHHLAGNIALAVVLLAFALAAAVYYFNLLDPADAKEQFPGVYDFLANKWYFDAAYSALLVRPALAVAHWCRLFDSKIIDGTVDGTARATVSVSRGSGRFDNGIVDGLVNVIGDTCYAIGNWLRNVQTGYLRSYVLFLVLAAVGIWVILSSLLGASPR